MLALHAVGRERALALARAPGGGRDGQQQRAVGAQVVGREQVDRGDLLDAELASGALVGERGVDEAVEQHERAVGEQRREALVHELRARGRVEQRLGAGGDVERGVLDERADALGELDAAGLAQQRDRQPARLDLLGERAGERALARAVEALDGDESAGGLPGATRGR